MTGHEANKTWLPYLVAIIGFLLTLSAWYFFAKNNQAYTYSLLSSYDSWLIVLSGLTISILFAFIVRIMQVAKQRALNLYQVNQNLKKEITERINAEQTKQRLESALLQSQKLQAIGTLAGGVAHDFNNLLYAIIGYVELAREDIPAENTSYKNLGKVLEATRRGQELIARLLAFSRRQHHLFDEISLKNTIEAALALLRPTIPASVSIHFDAASDIKIKGNLTKIHQVLINLINNAVDAMDGEGTITIELKEAQPNDPIFKQFPEARKEKYCKLVIKDTGHGMDQTTIARIFEPFFTTKEVGKGTGLGLSIVHSIVKEHQGEIIVESKLGQGTTFTLVLPVSDLS